jgi:uncharacterized membrane protein YedE/YeeE
MSRNPSSLRAQLRVVDKEGAMFTNLISLEPADLWRVGGGALLGVVFGLLVQRSRFCMLAAVSNLVLMRDFRQIRAYIAAVAVAIAGAQLLEASGAVELAASSYRGARLDWAGALGGGSSYRGARLDWAGALGGGLIFGFGTALAGGCVGRTLVRAAEGNLGAWLVLLVCAVTAAAVVGGPLSPLRQWLFDTTAVQLPGGSASLTEVLGLPPGLTIMLASLVVLVVIASAGHATRSGALIAAGVTIGGLVVAGWWITGALAQDEFSFTVARPVSLAFAGTLAQTVIATAGGGSYYAFGTVLLVGVLLGSAGSALLTRSFRWTMPQGTQLIRLLTGGSCMGTGAILAGGCNISLGLSGLSTCSVSAVLAVVAIFLGMRLGLVWLQHAEKSGPSVLVHS